MTRITCPCGRTALELTGPPILAATCHCTSCRRAAAELAALPGALPVTDANGGTPYVLWRKDRVALTQGGEFLKEHKLSTKGSRRAVATCCNAPMYLEFPGGHWQSFYAARFNPPPPTQMRTMLMDALPGSIPDDGIPGARRQSLGFMMKLVGAWAGTGFRFFKLAPMPPLEDSR
ncbi:MAG: hypothetical protein LCH92_16370 [Proteobacteria bacterium]|nr:hypothetical protein [Pseudomonadota bacterium]